MHDLFSRGICFVSFNSFVFANLAFVYSYFVPPEAIRGMQVKAHNVGLVEAQSLVDLALEVEDDLAMMMVENEVEGEDVEIVAYPSAWGVGRRVVRPKSI